MKRISLYFVGLILATSVLGFVAMFVPPVWAMCECTYNEIKSFLIFPGSLIAGLIVTLVTYLYVKRGGLYWKSFFRVLLYSILIFSVLGFLIGPIADFIKDTGIPIFQPAQRIVPATIIPGIL
jgi:hypothetical protein